VLKHLFHRVEEYRHILAALDERQEEAGVALQDIGDDFQILE